MHELGNVQYAAHSMHPPNPLQNGTSDPAEEEVTKIADDDAGAAVILNSWHTQDIQQNNQYSDALSSASQPTETEHRPKAIKAPSESTKVLIYSDPSKLRVKLAGEIEAINSFEGFMLGVHDKIEKFSRHTEFGLEQILDVEQRAGELYETLEVYKFTLKQIRTEALKVLRCQGNLGPQRVLRLLKDSTSEQVTEQAVATTEQNTE